MKHLKFLLLILFCFANNLLNAQQCETYYGKTINCTDKDSLKQGYWFEYKINKILTTDSFKRNPMAIGFHNDEGRADIPLSEGFYKSDKRIGEWKFYKGHFYNDSYLNATSHIQTTIFTDSGHFKIIDSFWNFFAKVSNDSNNLEGKIYLKENTIDVVCKDKLCYFYDPYKKSKKQKFPIKELEDKLIWLKYRSLRTKKI